jgi:formylglycine-generating enzyme required for sulfatase activity
MRFVRECFLIFGLALLHHNMPGRAQQPAARAFRDCAQCPEMVVIPAGSFTMGSSDSGRMWAVAHGASPGSVADEAPQHAVTLRLFALGTNDVTKGEYAGFVRETGYPAGDGCGLTGAKWIKHPNLSWRAPGFRQSDRDPVVCVSWDDANAYVKWLNDKTHRASPDSLDSRYRLPTESEWEYAARAGSSARFWWGDDVEAAAAHAWFAGNAHGRTHTSGLKPPNAFGLYDMSGNAWQWTEDCYADDYRNAPADGSAARGDSSCLRVDRGSAWFYPAWMLRPATRERNPHAYRYVMLGFRVARDMPASASLHLERADTSHTDTLSAQVRKYVRESEGRVVLEHVEVIDGTGSASRADQNLLLDHGRIGAISPGADLPPTAGTTILDLRGYSVMPGIVGMHNHLAYIAQPNLAADNSYLANGVTTMRTVGSIEPYTDIKLARAIEAGLVPGPHMDVTGPFLEGPNPLALPMPELSGPDDARQTVAFWADRGVTSFKAYQDITRDELRAVVDEAHRRGLKVTGHLCSVTYEEAAEIGIDNLEHGFLANTALDPDKQPDTCSASHGDYTLEHLSDYDANRLIALLVKHHVAITSTLPLRAAVVARESGADHGPLPREAVMEAMSPHARDAYSYWRNRPLPIASKAAALLRKEMDLERAFVAAGGLLIAGPDPVGIAGLVPGFADQRELELLVVGGFSPVQAILSASENGAE